jgi:hypothetical protein
MKVSGWLHAPAALCLGSESELGYKVGWAQTRCGPGSEEEYLGLCQVSNPDPRVASPVALRNPDIF